MPIGQLKLPKERATASSFSTHPLRSSGSKSTAKASFSHTTTSSVAARRSRAELGSLPPRKSQRGRRMSGGFARTLVRVGLIVILVGGIGFVSLVAWVSRDLPDPNKIIERDIAQSTKIYDRTGKTLLYEIHGTERRTLIELSDIPQYAVDATISIEDKNFYKHGALSLPNVAKAVVLDVLNKIHLYKGLVPGGSTLTQQFIKNAVLTTEKSYERKIKEFVLAYRLEKKFTKDEILKMYFNEIPYGSTAYGIESAAHIYFGKTAKDLTLAEAAVLAAMPQAPSYYSPYGSHKDELVARQRYVLDLMLQQRYITAEQAQAAKQEPLNFKLRREDILAPHFVMMVKEELAQRYGDRLVEQGGLKIITTLDYDKQKIAEQTIDDIVPKNAEKYNANNASLVSIDVKTGEVLALVGSKDFFDDSIDGQVNVATSPRQPGSSLKPIIYAEAFNQGYRPDTQVFDLQTSFAAGGAPYSPSDYDGKERGPIDLRHALQGSLNIPAVKVLYLVGVHRAIELAQQLGYSTLTDPDRYGLSLVLGGAEVKLIEHTNGYAALAREGMFKPYTDVLRVEDNKGSVLEEHHDSPQKRALPREVVRTLTSVMTDNDARAYIFGGSNYLTLPGRSVAAKTGTTNNYHDAWTLGFTPSVVTGVWVGNSNNAAMKRGADGSVIAAPIWQKYMSTVLSGTPVEGFATPPSLDPCDKPMLCGSVASDVKVRINKENGKLASPYTPESKIVEVTYKQVHEILQYVDRSNPTGPAPERPEDDPQYALWEAPVKKWAEKQGILTQEPPTEVDTQYNADDQPTINWISPQAGQTVSNNGATLNVSVSARHTISRVDFYLNSQLVSSVTQSPFSTQLNVTHSIPNGTYELKAVAHDDAGNEATSRITITLNIVRNDDWTVSWNTPHDGDHYPLAAAPNELGVAITNPEKIKKLDFYLIQNNNLQFLGFADVSGKTTISVPWTKPQQAGTYQLSIIATDLSGATYPIPKITFTIDL